MARLKGNLLLAGGSTDSAARTNSQTTYTASLHGKGDYIRQGPAGPIVEPCCTAVAAVVEEPMIMVVSVVTSKGPVTNDLPFSFGPGDSITVSWGDDSTPETFTAGPVRHIYTVTGSYTITVSGSANGFGVGASPIPNLPNITSVVQWGTLGLTSLSGAFYRCSRLEQVPTSLPSSVTDVSYMFYQASAFNGDISSWDVSAVTNMQSMFNIASAFNQPLAAWNVSAVTNMSNMFDSASSFNQPLAGWNVSAVTDMSSMFDSADAFNQPLALWNVSAVTNMSSMFFGAMAFNQPIGTWTVSNVTNMSGMFYNATTFDQPLAAWNVGAVRDMLHMFLGATAFNRPLAAWNVNAVTNMFRMFNAAAAFNADLSSWTCPSVPDHGADNMFLGSGNATISANWPTFVNSNQILP
jgi:surface protein